jgi:periplasmic protein TonB
MNGHVDTLDTREPLKKWMVRSLALHLGLVAACVVYSMAPHRAPIELGNPKGGGFGSVSVTAVSRIPIPSRSGPINPVASDTESRAPEPPPKAKPKPQVKAPEPDAIPIPSRNATKRPSEQASARNTFREKQQDLSNQIYNERQAAVSPMYSMPGGGGVGIGNNSPFGQQFGYYGDLLRNKVARYWRTNELDPRLHSMPDVVVTFTILHDGSVPYSSVQVVQRSGDINLDNSAKRAILDAAPFPPLPAGFPRNSADTEFIFQLRR